MDLKTALTREAASLRDYANECASHLTDKVLTASADRLDAMADEAGPPPIDVVAGVRTHAGLYWVARRNGDGEHGCLAGMWEYPGGKVEPGEGLREALVRELCEEFAREPEHIRVGRVLDSIDTRLGDKLYRVTFFDVKIDGPCQLLKHTEVRWLTPGEACAVDMLPSGTIFNARHLQERANLHALISRPYIGAWTDEVIIEAAHQRDRWGVEHDAGKEPQDFFWLVGYLAGKALRSAIDGDTAKARHHTVSTAAVLAQWAAMISGNETVFRPGIGPENLIRGTEG